MRAPSGTTRFALLATDARRRRTMGITFAKLFQRLFSKKEMRILMVRPPRARATNLARND